VSHRARLRRLLHRLQLTLGDVLASDRPTLRWSSAVDLQVDSRFIELDGADHWAFAGDQLPVLANIGRFVGSLRAQSSGAGSSAPARRDAGFGL
jgi:DNA-binding SARP family transcriptional activator